MLNVLRDEQSDIPEVFQLENTTIMNDTSENEINSKDSIFIISYFVTFT